MPALFATGVTLALERDMGLLRLKRAQPAPPASWVVAKIVSGLVLAVLAYLPIAHPGAGRRQARARRRPGGGVERRAAGRDHSVLRARAHDRFAGERHGRARRTPISSIYPAVISPACFSRMPKSMYWQAPIWPQYHVKQFAMHLAGITQDQSEPLSIAIAVMLGFTVLFAACDDLAPGAERLIGSDPRRRLKVAPAPDRSARPTTGERNERSESTRFSAGRRYCRHVFGSIGNRGGARCLRRRHRRRSEYLAPGNHSDAPHQVFRYRPRPRAHLWHDPRHSARRRRAGLLLFQGSGADRAVPQGVRRREARRERRRNHRGQVHPAGAGRAHPRSARPARHPRHEGRQGLPRRQTRASLRSSSSPRCARPSRKPGASSPSCIPSVSKCARPCMPGS